MEGVSRLPLSDPRRIRARDAKLLLREGRLAQAQTGRKWRCMCRLCIGSVRSARKWEHCAKHLEEVGRHPFHRGITAVSNTETHVRYHVCSTRVVCMRAMSVGKHAHEFIHRWGQSASQMRGFLEGHAKNLIVRRNSKPRSLSEFA